MSKLNGWAMAAAAVMAMAPAAFGAARPTKHHVVAADGSVFYPDREAGAVVRVNPDGTSEIVANGLDAPTGVDIDGNGDLIIGDEVGIRRVLLAEGLIQTLRTLPTDFEPEVRFDQPSWKYNKKTDSVQLVFSHNLKDQNPAFRIEVSRDGGYTWSAPTQKIRSSNYVWELSSEDRDQGRSMSTMRFRVTAFVGTKRVASDVSDVYERPGR